MSTIKTITTWKEGLAFNSQAGDQALLMDGAAPEIRQAATPKQALLAAMASCAGIDVVSILQKMRASIEQCEILSETETTDSYPSVFKSVQMDFQLKGATLKADQVLKSVHLSMTKYCGVTAMIADAIPVYYRVILNGQVLFEGQANFAAED